MISSEFIKASRRTDLSVEQYAGALTRMVELDPRLTHGVFGLVTEAGEMLDALKKHLFYGAPLDLTNIKEELGDVEWYMSLILTFLGTTHDSIFELNVAKLKSRYPERFEESQALNRDLQKERKILEE